MKKTKKVQLGYIFSISFLMICSALFLGLFIYSSANLDRYEQQALFAARGIELINNESEKQVKEELNLFLISNDNKNRTEKICIIEVLSQNLSTSYLYSYIQIIKPAVLAGEITDKEIEELKKFCENPNREYIAAPEVYEHYGIKAGDFEEIDARSLVTDLFKQNNGITYINYNEYRGTYNYKVILPSDNFYMVEVLKKGKVLFNLSYNGNKTAGALAENECRLSADRFLKAAGFNLNLAETVKTEFGFKFTYIPVVENVKIYSRKVEIEVSSALGEVLSFDASYYTRNGTPDNLSVNLSPNEAQGRLNKNLEVKDCSLVVILIGTKQVLCYRFKTNYTGSEYIIYINAKTGEEHIGI